MGTHLSAMFQLARCMRLRTAQVVSTLNATNAFSIPVIPQLVRPFNHTSVLNCDWQGEVANGNKIERRAGDWDCPECGAHCFANRATCFKCSAANPDYDPERKRQNTQQGGSTPAFEAAADPGGLNGSGEMSGTVTNWTFERGFGFITPADGSDDIFCHLNNIEDGNALEVGTEVTFDSVYDDIKDKTRAENVAGGVVAERAQNQRGGSPNRQRQSGPPSEPAADPGGLNGSGETSGTVTNWNSERGFGFITPADGSEDIFCHVNNIEDGNALEVGSEVTFDSTYDDNKDKYRAENVAGGVVQEREQNQRGGSPNRQRQIFAQVPSEPPTDPGGLNGSGEMRGTVANWNSDRGFGFISPADGSEDIFCHVNNIEDGNGLEVGTEVSFDSSYDDFKDKYRAENVAGGVVQEREYQE